MFAVFVCCCLLLPLVAALPTNYAQNISLGYVGDTIADLDTINNMTVVDPAMADPLKNAIAAAWPDYYAHLVNGNESTTTMSPEEAAWFTQTNLVNFWVDFHNETGISNSSDTLQTVTTMPGIPLLSPVSGGNGTTTVLYDQSNTTLGGLSADGITNSSGIVNASSIVTVSPIGNGTDLLNTTLGPIAGDLNNTSLNGTTLANDNSTLLPGMATTVDPLFSRINGTTTVASLNNSGITTVPTELGVDGQNGTAVANGSFPLLRDSAPGVTGLDNHTTTVASLTPSSGPLNNSSLPLGLDAGTTTVSPLNADVLLSENGTTIVPPLVNGTSIVPLIGDGTSSIPPLVDGSSIVSQLGGSTTIIPQGGDVTSTVDPLAAGGTTTVASPTTISTTAKDGTMLLVGGEAATTTGIPTN